MKLTARKSMVAMGTALAMSLTPVAVPTMAPTVFAADNASHSRYATQLKNEFTAVSARQEALKAEYDALKIDAEDTEAINKAGQANIHLGVAANILDNVALDVKTEDGKLVVSESLNEADMKELIKSLNKATTEQNSASNDIAAARSAQFKCPNAVNTNGEEGSSGSSMDSFTSSGNRVVVENGKRKCVSNSTYMTDKLTKLVTVLGTIFTLVTTVTKISDVFMKNNPLVPPAA